MKTIASFTVNHDKLKPGIYISRVDGDITTYDLRTRIPNAGDYMDHLTMHSLEHMFATYIRNSEIGKNVIYFGPMGCRTGFYLLVRDIAPKTVANAVKSVLAQIRDHDGEMFGATRQECGNYRELDLAEAKKEASAYLEVLEASDITFEYPDLM